jgi:hypothetical protein
MNKNMLVNRNTCAAIKNIQNVHEMILNKNSSQGHFDKNTQSEAICDLIFSKYYGKPKKNLLFPNLINSSANLFSILPS